MPTARHYTPNSIIYFMGDKANEVYILQKGKVMLISMAPDTGEEVREIIKSGEVFGVKSVLGKYPREETAQVIEPSVVIAFTPEEFEALVKKNFDLLLKMLKVFSAQLRKIGKKVRALLEKGEPKLPETEMFFIGEYYLKQKKINQAKYVYKRYLECYPTGPYVEKCKERLQQIEQGIYPSFEEKEVKEEKEDFFIEKPTPKSESKKQPTLEEEEKPESLKVTEGIDITKKYYEGVSLFSQEKYQEAAEIFKEVTSVTKIKDNATLQIVEKAFIDLGRCYLKLNEPLKAIETLSTLLKKFQKTPLFKDALYEIAHSYEQMGNLQKALNFYRKVVNTPPKEEINKMAKKALERLEKQLLG